MTDLAEFRNDLGPLRTTSTEMLALPSGRSIEIPICRTSFPKWEGEPIDNYGGKTILNFKGTPVYAELAVLGMLRERGWEGFWIDTYGKRYRRSLDETISGTDPAKSYLPFERYPTGFKKFGGAWDIVAWKGEAIIFIECKRSKKDAIRPNQLSWMEARLAEGARHEDFMIVEWDLCAAEEEKKLKLIVGHWYAYQMLPGYLDAPYFSPIRIERIDEHQSGKISLEFYNAAYAEGVRDFRVELKVVSDGDNFVVVRLLRDPPRERRVAIIAEINGGWANIVIPRPYLERNPMTAIEEQDGDYQSYFRRLSLAGLI